MKEKKPSLVTLGVNLVPDLYARLEALSKRTQKPKTYFMREAISKYIQEVENDLHKVSSYK